MQTNVYCVYIFFVDVGKNTNEYYEFIQLSQGIHQGRVEAFLNQRPDAVNEWINFYETPLLKACARGKPEIVKELLRRMTPEQMLPKMSQNTSYHTPLTIVAGNGNMEIAEVLIAKNPKLLEIPGSNGKIPVVVAVKNTQMEMVRYLYTRTPVQVLFDEDGYHGTVLFVNAIFYKMLGKWFLGYQATHVLHIFWMIISGSFFLYPIRHCVGSVQHVQTLSRYKTPACRVDSQHCLGLQA